MRWGLDLRAPKMMVYKAEVGMCAICLSGGGTGGMSARKGSRCRRGMDSKGVGRGVIVASCHVLVARLGFRRPVNDEDDVNTTQGKGDG